MLKTLFAISFVYAFAQASYGPETDAVLIESVKDVFGGGLCAVEHCSSEMFKCLKDGPCRKQMQCITGCTDVVDVGGCASLCLVSYPSDVSTALSACLNWNECLPLPFPMNDTCKTTHPGAVPFNMSDLVADPEWWVLYGLNPTADCSVCQRRHIYPDPVNTSNWWYDYSSLTQAENKSYFNYTLHTPLWPSEEQLTSMDSWRWPWGQENGLPFVEEWWMLDDGEEYKQVYYCVTMPDRDPTLQLEGSIILATSPNLDLDDEALARISLLYGDMGVDFNTFCEVDNSCIPGNSILRV